MRNLGEELGGELGGELGEELGEELGAELGGKLAGTRGWDEETPTRRIPSHTEELLLPG